MIERHYAAFIVDAMDELAARSRRPAHDEIGKPLHRSRGRATNDSSDKMGRP